MKTHSPPKLIRGLAIAAGGLALFTGALTAAPFLYSPGDLVLAFRQTGNASDYAVNVGKATNFSTLPTGTTLVISNLSVAQLNSAFPSVNGLAWSVAAANRPPLVPDFPLQTIWVTAPRLDPNVQSPPWLRKGQFVQGTAASQIDAVGVNAAASSSSQPAGPNNTAAGVLIPVNTDFAFTPLIGDAGDYVGTFQGNVENTTPDDFDGDAENVSRSDLYELLPGTSAGGTLNAPGRYLGYFELKPDASLTFNTGAPPLPRPSLTNIGRNGDVATVSFTTVNGATYRLRFTDAPGLTSPVSTWSTGASITGNGSVLSLQDTNLVYYVSRPWAAGQRTIVQRENGFPGIPIFYYWDTANSQFVIDPTGRSSTQIRDLLNISGPAVSYLTGVDAIGVNGGANILAYNGHKAFLGSYSAVSNDLSPVINGQYTQWGYEHTLNRTTVSANIRNFRDRLIQAIDADLQTSAFSIPLSKLRVERTAEGGPVSPIE